MNPESGMDDGLGEWEGTGSPDVLKPASLLVAQENQLGWARRLRVCLKTVGVFEVDSEGVFGVGQRYSLVVDHSAGCHYGMLHVSRSYELSSHWRCKARKVP